MGIIAYREIICCLLRQTTITTACNRARESTLGAVSGVESVESAWSPDAQESPRGVHRRPNPVCLSIVAGGRRQKGWMDANPPWPAFIARPCAVADVFMLDVSKASKGAFQGTSPAAWGDCQFLW